MLCFRHALPESPPDSGSEPPYSPPGHNDTQHVHSPRKITNFIQKFNYILSPTILNQLVFLFIFLYFILSLKRFYSHFKTLLTLFSLQIASNAFLFKTLLYTLSILSPSTSQHIQLTNGSTQPSGSLI